jgi:type IV secretory pathway VirJ component
VTPRARVMRWAVLWLAPAALATLWACPCAGDAPTQARLMVRGKPQTVRLYGAPDGQAFVVASGDGGWIHLAPRVAELLAARGAHVVGVDSRAYLAGFTDRNKTLTVSEVPDDFRVFVEAARAGRERPVVLVGVSLGAGLAVLAATQPRLKPLLAGVVGLGLPEENELGWRWQDSIIYLTKKTPNEPLFLATETVPRVAPVPLALIHSTDDEFAPLEEARRVAAAAAEPKRLWVVEARNHRFSGGWEAFVKALDEALAWLGQHDRQRADSRGD